LCHSGRWRHSPTDFARIWRFFQVRRYCGKDSCVSVEMHWHEKGKIFVVSYDGVVTPDELTGPINTIYAHLNSGTNYLHVIVDWRKATDYPYFVDFMFPGLKLIRHPRMGWMLLVGESGTLTLSVDLFSTVASFRYKIVPTL